MGIEPDDLDRFLAGDAATYLDMGFTQFTLGFNGPALGRGRGRRVPRLARRAQRRAARAGGERERRVRV